MTDRAEIRQIRVRLMVASAIVAGLFLPQMQAATTATYDAWTHAFFASHYLHGWWTAVDHRWYLGFKVTSYPPLAHQMLAVLAWPSIVAGAGQVEALGRAYLVLVGALTFAYPIAAYRFASVFVSNRAAATASILAATFTGWWTLVFWFGQLTTAYAGVLVLFGGYALNRYLHAPGVRNGITACLLAALVPMTHHFTAISFLPAAYIAVIAKRVVRADARRAELTRSVRLGAPVAAGAAALVAVALFPFVESLLERDPRPVIPHASREAWFADPVLTQPQVWIALFAGGLLLLGVPLTVRNVQRRNPGAAPLVALAAVFGVLSMGFTTPLPRLVYPSLAESLTYFRFATWGGFLLCPAVGAVVERWWQPLERTDISRSDAFRVAVAIAIVSSQIVVATQIATVGDVSEDNRAVADELATFMAADEHWKWRYLTLGMGWDLGLFGIAAPHAQTIDGNYNTGRSPEKLPVLVRTGAAQLANAKHSQASRTALRHYLAENEQYGLKFVFSSDQYYADLLKENGFVLLYDWSWLGIRVWEDADAPTALDSRSATATGRDWRMVSWGTVPVSTLVALLLSGAWTVRRRGCRVGRPESSQREM